MLDDARFAECVETLRDRGGVDEIAVADFARDHLVQPPEEASETEEVGLWNLSKRSKFLIKES